MENTSSLPQDEPDSRLCCQEDSFGEPAKVLKSPSGLSETRNSSLGGKPSTDEEFEEFIHGEAANPAFAAFLHQEDEGSRGPNTDDSIHADNQTVVSEITLEANTSLFRGALYQKPIEMDIPDDIIHDVFKPRVAESSTLTRRVSQSPTLPTLEETEDIHRIEASSITLPAEKDDRIEKTDTDEKVSTAPLMDTKTKNKETKKKPESTKAENNAYSLEDKLSALTQANLVDLKKAESVKSKEKQTCPDQGKVPCREPQCPRKVAIEKEYTDNQCPIDVGDSKNGESEILEDPVCVIKCSATTDISKKEKDTPPEHDGLAENLESERTGVNTSEESRESMWSLPDPFNPTPHIHPGIPLVVDHRSGIPGAFGVGDVESYLDSDPDPDPAVGTGDRDLERAEDEEMNANLVLARPVSDDNLQIATPDPNSEAKKQMWEPACWQYLLGICVIICAISMAGICGAGLCGATADNPKHGASPILVPTSFRSTRIDEFKPQLVALLGEDYFDQGNITSLETRNKVLDWIANDDFLQLEPGNPAVIQRFVMSLFYLQTTAFAPWKDCNPEAGTQPMTCYTAAFLRFRDSDGTLEAGDYDMGDSWLSESHECFWAGVECVGYGDSNVTGITLLDNGLNGLLPTELAILSWLSVLHLQANHLTGTIPAQLANLSSLHTLRLEHNSLTGTIPAILFESMRKLEFVSFSSNALSGTIPAEAGRFQGTFMGFESNFLTGSIPSNLFIATNLTVLKFADNDITGSIPTEIGVLSSLIGLIAWGTDLSGIIPSEVSGLQSLQELDISNTNLEGPIPEGFFELTSLINVKLGDSAFSGTISTNLGRLTNLQELEMANNDFYGTIPSEISSLEHMLRFVVNGNRLSGTMPLQYCNNMFSHAFDLDRQVVADCLHDESTGVPDIQCTCCTECCSTETGECQMA